MSNTLIVLEAVWDSGVTVAADEALNEGGPPQHIGHRADVHIFELLAKETAQGNQQQSTNTRNNLKYGSLME